MKAIQLTNESAPLAREIDDLIVEELPDELLIYDRSNYKTHCLNSTATLIWKNCNGRNTIADIAQILSLDQQVVLYGINQLERRSLLRSKTDYPKISRRNLIRSIAILSLLPAISSITAPTAQAQGSGTCGHIGDNCGIGGRACCPGCSCLTDAGGTGRHCVGLC